MINNNLNNTLHKWIVFSLFAYILLFNPFITDVIVPKTIRFIPPLIFFSLAFYILFANCRKSLKKIVLLVLFLSLFLVVWLIQNTLIISQTILVISSICLALFLFGLLYKKQVNINLLIKYWNYVVWVSIIMSILSFIFFNFFNNLTFINKPLGSYSESNSYLSPLFGVISEKNILQFKLGRVSWLLSEPSYLGFFQVLNFFWFKYLEKWRNYPYGKLGKLMAITGLFCSLSLGSWISFLIAFFISTINNFIFIRKKLNLQKINKNIVFILIVLVCTIAFNDQLKNVFQFFNDFYENIDKYSSLENRNERVENSTAIFNSSNYIQIFMGLGPGTIEDTYQFGESNGWLKSIIEEGIILTLLYMLSFLIMILYNKKNLFLSCFVLISFNSVILVFSPVIIFYLLMLYFIASEIHPNYENFTCS